MQKVILKTDLSCKHCVAKVEPVLKTEKGVIGYTIDLEHPDKLITISSEGAEIRSVISKFKRLGYSAEVISG